MANVPLIFSRDRNRGFKVPRTWQSGGCVVRVDVISADEEEVSTMEDVFVQAGLINGNCVALHSHLGGTVALGAEEKMNVTVLGWSPLGVVAEEE